MNKNEGTTCRYVLIATTTHFRLVCLAEVLINFVLCDLRFWFVSAWGSHGYNNNTTTKQQQQQHRYISSSVAKYVYNTHSWSMCFGVWVCVSVVTVIVYTYNHTKESDRERRIKYTTIKDVRVVVCALCW